MSGQHESRGWKQENPPSSLFENPYDEGSVRPRVFLMTNNFDTGGSERQFTLLAHMLRPEAFHVRVGCIKARGPLLREANGLAEFPLGGGFFTRQARESCGRLAGHLRTLGIALAHSFDFYTNLMMIPVARLAGVPVVIGSHRQIGDLLTPLQFGAQATIFRLCDCVVCNSRAAADRLLDQGLPENKLAVIPNLLPEEAFAESAPALPRQPEVVRVGMVARMNHAYKGHAAFLRAAGTLARKFPSVEFVLVGDGPLRPHLEQMAERLGLARRVVFLGERHDIPAVLAALDVSVLPSVSESLSNVILESMAAGLPVVATRVGGNPEIVIDGETGFLVPPDNQEGLVDRVEGLLTYPWLRKKLGQRARSLALANFRIDNVRDQYEQLYANLLSERCWQPRRRHFDTPTKPRPDRLRVAIVAPTLKWVGGQAVQANLLFRHWQNDAAVEVRFIPVDPELPRWLTWVERVPYLRTVVREPFYLASLWRHLKGVDIAHVFSASYWSFLLAPAPACLISRWRAVKTVINYHSGEALDHLRRWRTALPVLRSADRVVVPSAYLVRIFREFGLEAQSVPNIVDLRQFSYRPRQPLRPLLICTRGFGPYYSVDLVVRAFARVKEEFPAARLCLVGKGALEPQVRALACGLKVNDIDFVGAVSHHEIGRFYDQCDIFINASWLDNMPISVLEAFASGTPVVTTAPEGIRFIVEHERTGLLSEPGDWQALAASAIRLLREPDLASRLAQNAYQESRKYRWEVVRPLWLAVYRSLASHDGRESESRLLSSTGNGSLQSPPSEGERASPN